MKKITILLLLFTVTFSVPANEKNNNTLTSAEETAKNNLKNTINPKYREQLQLENDTLEGLINEENPLRDRLENLEKWEKSQSAIDVVEFVSDFNTLYDFWTYNKETFTKTYNDPNDETVKTYSFIIDVYYCLDTIYNAETNKELKNRLSEIKPPIEKHRKEYETLISQLNDYRLAMFELGRLFAAYDKYKSDKSNEHKKISLKKLANNEEVADEIIEIPYISKGARRYLSGKMEDNEKRLLYEACPNAFPMFKNIY